MANNEPKPKKPSVHNANVFLPGCLGPRSCEVVLAADFDRYLELITKPTEQDKAQGVVELPEPLKLSDDVQEYLREGMESATGCEDDDIDFDFANGLEQLLHPIYRADAVQPLFDRVQAERDVTLGKVETMRRYNNQANKENDALRAEVERLKSALKSIVDALDTGERDQEGRQRGVMMPGKADVWAARAALNPPADTPHAE